jgi:outer membrane protein assembly factor BamA
VVIACVSVMILSLAAGNSAAQDTRADEITQKQQQKAEKLTPYEPSRFERVMNRLERNFVDPVSGFYPALGRVYPGGSLSLGGGYRQFVGRNSALNVEGLYSIRNYKLIEVGARTPWNLDGRWTLATRAGWLDAPQVGYYGLGPDTTDADRANFRLSQTFVEAIAGFRPTQWARLGAELALEDYSTDEGRGNSPSIETRFDSQSAPGLFSNPLYIRAQATAAIDWRTSAGYSRKGGYYGVSLVSYTDRDDTFSFNRVDLDAVQHLPILRETWVISVRARAQSTLDDDDLVPYFMLPYLGGGRTLRAYATGRFRDRHALLTTAEFRWIPNRTGLDMALFYDAGTVAPRRRDLSLKSMTSNWGIGARFHGPTTTVLRIEAARGSEGWNLVFATSAPF